MYIFYVCLSTLSSAQSSRQWAFDPKYVSPVFPLELLGLGFYVLFLLSRTAFHTGRSGQKSPAIVLSNLMLLNAKGGNYLVNGATSRA